MRSGFLLSILVLFAPTLRAQPLNCGPYYGRTLSNFATVRPTGMAEMIGEVAVLCTGGSGVTHNVTVTLSLSLPITSANPTGSKSDAILFVNDPQRSAMVAGENAFVGEFDPPAPVFRDTAKRVRVLEYGNSELYNGGGLFEGKPGAAQDSEGNTWIVARDSAKGLWTTRFNVAAKTFDAWTFVGGQTQSDPSVTVGEDGTMYYLVRDDWNNSWLGTFQRGAGNSWKYLGGVFSSDPQVAWSRPGYLLIAGRDNWGGVWTKSIATMQEAASYEANWTFRGGIVKEQISITPQVGVTLLATRDPGNGLWFAYISPPSTFTWLAGQGVIDRGPEMAGRAALGAVANTVWAKYLDTTLVNPLPWMATGGVLVSEAAGWLNNELYVIGQDANKNLWWYRSVTGAWTKTSHTGVVASEISAAPR